MKKGNIIEGDKALLKQVQTKIQDHTIGKNTLPVSMDPTSFGNILSVSNIENGTRYMVNNLNQTFMIDSYQEGTLNKCTLLGASNFSLLGAR